MRRRCTRPLRSLSNRMEDRTETGKIAMSRGTGTVGMKWNARAIAQKALSPAVTTEIRDAEDQRFDETCEILQQAFGWQDAQTRPTRVCSGSRPSSGQRDCLSTRAGRAGGCASRGSEVRVPECGHRQLQSPAPIRKNGFRETVQSTVVTKQLHRAGRGLGLIPSLKIERLKKA